MQFLDVTGARKIKELNDAVYLTADNVGSASGAQFDVYTKAQVDTLLNATIPTATSGLTNDSGFVVSSDITRIVKITQSQYDVIDADNNTLYIIVKDTLE